MSKRGKKVALLGEAGVGKTSLAMRITRDLFKESYDSTIGAAYMKVKILDEKTGKMIPFDIWDTAGQERYRSLAPMYYRGADVVLLVFDLSNFDTLQRLAEYLKELVSQPKKNFGCIVVGTKLDLIDDYQLKKKTDLIMDTFEQYNSKIDSKIEYIYLSSKEKTNIEEFKQKLIAVSGDYNEDEYKEDDEKINLESGSYSDYVPGCSC